MLGINWRKASACESSACAEVRADLSGQVYLRNNTTPEVEPLRFDVADWRVIVADLRNGLFNDL